MFLLAHLIDARVGEEFSRFKAKDRKTPSIILPGLASFEERPLARSRPSGQTGQRRRRQDLVRAAGALGSQRRERRQRGTRRGQLVSMMPFVLL